MGELDLRTIVFCTGLAQLVNVGATTWLAYIHRSTVRGPTWWAIGIAFVAAGYFLLLPRGILPDFLTIVCANSLLVAGLLCLLTGLERFRRRRLRRRWWLVILTLTAIGLLVFTYGFPSLLARISVMGLAVSAVAIAILFELRLIARERGVPGVIFLAITFGAALAAFIVRSVASLFTERASPGLFEGSALQSAFFLFLLVVILSMSYGFLFLTAFGLQMDLDRLAHRDELTGLHNRRAFMARARAELAQAIRYGRPLSLVMLDLDHFKQINDSLGHAAGDEALVLFAQMAKESLREHDVCARIGGEEFGLLLPETATEQAALVVERLKLRLVARPLDFDGRLVTLAFSAGICALRDERQELAELLRCADRLLYQAKESGRNKILAEPTA